MPELGLSPVVTQTLDNDYSWLWSPDMAYHFSGGLTINPARISVRLFSGLGYAPDPCLNKHFWGSTLDDPDPDAVLSLRGDSCSSRLVVCLRRMVQGYHHYWCGLGVVFFCAISTHPETPLRNISDPFRFLLTGLHSPRDPTFIYP